MGALAEGKSAPLKVEKPQAPSNWGTAKSWLNPLSDLLGKGEGPENRAVKSALESSIEASEIRAETRRFYSESSQIADSSPRIPSLKTQGNTGGLLGKSGVFAKRSGDPKRIRAARTFRKEARFLARTGAQKFAWLSDDIPDGEYRYRLDALDLRGSDGDGRIAGVYLLGRKDPFRMVANLEVKGEIETRKNEGDFLLERLFLKGQQGEKFLLERSETRLYLIQVSKDPFQRTMWDQSLDAPDGSREGNKYSKRQIARLLKKEKLTHSSEPLDPLKHGAKSVEEMDQDLAVRTRHPRKGAPTGCSGGVCVYEAETVGVAAPLSKEE